MDTESVAPARRLGCSECGDCDQQLGSPCWFALRLGPTNRAFLCPDCANREAVRRPESLARVVPADLPHPLPPP